MIEDPPQTEVRRRPGGRSERVRASVLMATILELAECGYEGMRFERIATRAGVHKTTIYRRWPDRPALVQDALYEHTGAAFAIPDTGDTREDLRIFLRSIVSFITMPIATAMLRFLVAEAPKIPELRSFAEETRRRRFVDADRILIRGMVRGDLPPDTDPRLRMETCVAPIYVRVLISEEPVDYALVERLITLVLGPEPPTA